MADNAAEAVQRTVTLPESTEGVDATEDNSCAATASCGLVGGAGGGVLISSRHKLLPFGRWLFRTASKLKFPRKCLLHLPKGAGRDTEHVAQIDAPRVVFVHKMVEVKELQRR